MRDLTETQANACEQALHTKCKCRCRGTLHGARRLGIAAPDADKQQLREIFSALPPDDPHYSPPITRGEAQRILHSAAVHLKRPATRERDLVAVRDALYILRVAWA